MIPSTSKLCPYHKYEISYYDRLLVSATRNDAAGTIVARGAENVGQAQILSDFSKPFELEGLFGAADAGAFAGRVGAHDVPMGMADEDGDVFWDAVDGPEGLHSLMDGVEDGIPMESDDLKHIIPRKRSRSPSEALMQVTTSLTREEEAASRFTRQPKRQRKAKDVPAYNAPPDEHVSRQMAKNNPLSRRVLKREAKRARKAYKVKVRGDLGGSMEVDADGLQFTFMA